MKHRKEIISFWSQKIGATKYLELGLRNPHSVFNHIPCPIKHSVDINDSVATYTMSTDVFFKTLGEGGLDLKKDYKWDVIFIDANHLGDFVKNDILNSLNHLSEGGMVFLHDVLPLKYEHQYETGGNQTAWKVIPYFLKYYPQLHICTTDENDGGIGIVFPNKSRERKTLNPHYNVFYEYYIMDKDRKTSQNYINEQDLEGWVDNPYYNFEEQIITHKENMFKDFFKKI